MKPRRPSTPSSPGSVEDQPALKHHLDVGYVSRAHGIKGEVVVRTYDPSSEALFDVERVLLRSKAGDEREVAIEELREHSGDLLVRFEGVLGREGSEALVGSAIAVFRDDLDAPAEGEFFQGDLVGLEAWTVDGRLLGRVIEVWSSGPVPNLVIKGEGSEELMVPFAQEFVPSVDLAARKVTIIVPELT